jgi:hypothetical protein
LNLSQKNIEQGACSWVGGNSVRQYGLCRRSLSRRSLSLEAIQKFLEDQAEDGKEIKKTEQKLVEIDCYGRRDIETSVLGWSTSTAIEN